MKHRIRKDERTTVETGLLNREITSALAEVANGAKLIDAQVSATQAVFVFEYMTSAT